MQIRCSCGATLVVAPHTTSVVCAGCQQVVAVPQGQPEIGLEDTVLALTPMAEPRRVPTPAPTLASPAKPTWPLVLLGIALVAGAGAIAFYALRDDAAKREQPAPIPPPPTLDAAPVVTTPAATAGSLEELLVLERSALAKADEAALAALLAPNAFAHGPDAGNVAYTGPAAAGMLSLAFKGTTKVESTWAKIVRKPDYAWVADELSIEQAGKPRTLMTTQLAFRDGTTWRIAAWHVAELVPNDVAAKHQRAGTMPTPATLQDQFDDDHQVHDAFRAIFATAESLAAGFSENPDALNHGSAPGERVLGARNVRGWLAGAKPTFRVHDGVAAGRVNDRVGWAAGNVDYKAKEEQTYRLFAVLVREKDGWRVVLAQWSNAGPLP